MAILKPNIPLKYVKPDGTTQSEYPLTSIDQVIDEDGIHRLNQTIVRADLSDVEEGQVVLTNADLLDNHPASYFATSEDLNTKANKSEVDSAIEELNTTIANAGKFYGIDTNNIIATGGADNSYTATQDSWFWLHNVDTGYITFNGKVTTNSRNDSHTAVFPLKAGDKIVPYKFQTWTSMKWYVFGVKS